MFRICFFFLVFALTFRELGHACPASNGVPDFNCDGKVVVSIIGDSLVFGYGDVKNNNKGGYVLRAQNKLPKIQFDNLGVQGLNTTELMDIIKDAFKSDANSTFKQSVLEADLIILDLGRNDRWFFGPPIATYRNLKRISSQLKKFVNDGTGYSPLIVTAVLMLPNRGSQGPWVKELNDYILRGHSEKSPADLRFDKVSKRLLSTDQIHPTPEGYSALASTFLTYMKKKVPGKMRKLRPDSDKDDIPDIFEADRFGTDPANPDTDGDGRKDGEEIFSDQTDPLLAD